MAESISSSIRSGRDGGTSPNWSLVLGVIASILALAYLTAALHARCVIGAPASPASGSSWFPVQLFVIATSPALAGFIFLWSEHHLHNRTTRKMFLNIGIFGFGMFLAIWVALALK